MPVYSMTGYASAQSGAAQPGAEAESNKAPRLRIGVEIRSVNSRFLDLAFRLPEELRQHEPALRNLLNGRLKRGKVELRAAIETPQTAQVADPSPRLLQRLNAVQDQVLAWLPGARPLSVADVIRLASAEGQQPGDLGEQLLPLAGAALAEMISAREREGHRLAGMLTGHLVQLRALAAQAMPLVPQLVDQQRQRFLARWQEAMGLANPASGDLALPSEAAQDRAMTEATAFAIRIDVAEELTRLSSHLDEIERLIAQGGEVGKRLDFLIQELHREANTLGSKSAVIEMTRISVDMKVLIEQMREQVQNIE
jgi:uncharacterized protein (TIGR00255 family)